ncbi:Ig-like domain (group 3) [Nocardioides exalbidus]|uniref:Ig-like domain (Group 3) n=1 Tax=Nocardioides exalbidus TaxID=402596 RepID=A0A1H4K5M1_9ACTN|nr:Ig-like domain repeat protein [Nocardioides exalbidus]SEB53677.1 Ig-like domain (group 3) [Nocardioides exalbidus]
MRRSVGSRIGATSALSLLLAAGALATVPGTVQASGSSVGTASDVDLPRPARGASAVRLLGDQVDEAAALNGMTGPELDELLTTDRTAWLDLAGRVFFKENGFSAPATGPVEAVAPLDQTFALHSKADSARTIFLDFDGGTASGTSWHATNASVPTTQPGWDPSGNGAAFDDLEKAKIQAVWAAVAEDYAPFDVDVTTQDPGPSAIHRSSPADTTYGSHVLITPSTGAQSAICRGGCGGVAYLRAFGQTQAPGGDGYGYYQPAWVFPQSLSNSSKAIAEAASHEVGHNLGLDHDGSSTGNPDYDAGHGAWAPIMGVGYYKAISQWSKGDYNGANEHQDDVAIITSVVGLRTDEAPPTIVGAPALPGSTAYIAARADVDTYALGTCSGPVTVDAEPLAAATNLDIGLSLLDATGQVVASADPPSAQVSDTTASGMDASLSRTLASGQYYVAVDGVGNGTWTTGYDDYGSLGAYTLSRTGSCDGVAPVTWTPTPTPTPTPTTPPATTPTTPTVPTTPPGSTSSSPPAPATLRVKAPATARAGSRPRVVVTVDRGSVAATGTVVVTAGKKSWTLALSSGTAKVRLPRVKAGRLRISVRYSGDATTLPATSTWVIKVKR